MFVLAVDHDHRTAKAIQLDEGFALGGFDHQRARDGERHGRGVESIVDQAFGDVIDTDVGFAIHGARVDDAFVRDQPVIAGVKDRVVVLQAMRDIVGVEDSDLRGPS